MKLFITLALIIAGPAIHPKMDGWAIPTVAQIAGYSCTQDLPDIRVQKQDPLTHYYSGRIYAVSSCGDEQGMIYRGCADVSWDPTGTTYALKILWQEKLPLPDVNNQRHTQARCISGAP